MSPSRPSLAFGDRPASWALRLSRTSWARRIAWRSTASTPALAHAVDTRAARWGELDEAVTLTMSSFVVPVTVTSFCRSSTEVPSPSRRAVARATLWESTAAMLSWARLSASSEVGSSPVALSSGPIVWLKSSLDVDW